MQRGPREIRKFGAFEIDSGSGELRKHGIRLKLQDQPFLILAALLERPGEIVTREELRSRIWPADTFVDFDHGLYSAIKRLRNALGDSAELPRYIETVSRRGYRFVAPVQTVEPNSGHSLIRDGSSGSIVPRRGRVRRWIIPAAVIAVALVFTVLAKKLFFAPRTYTIALLPFSVPSGDHFLESAAETLTNSLIVNLTTLHGSGLTTKARASVQPYRAGAVNPVQAGKELHADFIFAGKLARAEGQLSADVDLISVDDGISLWAGRDLRWERFQVKVAKTDLLKQVVDHLPIKLSNVARNELLGNKSELRVQPEIEELDRKAQSLFWIGTPETFRKSIALREQALQVKESPQLMGGIASAYAAMAVLEFISPQEGRAKALEWAHRALEQDATDFGALITIDSVEKNLEWDSEGFKENDFVKQNLGEVLIAAKRFVTDSPRLPAAFDFLAEDLILAHRFTEAAEQARISLELEPGRAWAHYHLARAYLHQRRFEDAFAEFSHSSEALPIQSATGIAQALALAGRKQEAIGRLEELKKLAETHYVSPMMFARIYAALEDRDNAFRYMNAACQDRVPALLKLHYDPAWDGLRKDHRFSAILRCAGLQS